MTGMRPSKDHQSRLDWWHRQIQRQPKTDLTIADFCRQLGVSVPTFYYWKRRVQAGIRTSSEPVVEPSRSWPPTTAAAPFLPVSIVDPDAGTRRRSRVVAVGRKLRNTAEAPEIAAVLAGVCPARS